MDCRGTGRRKVCIAVSLLVVLGVGAGLFIASHPEVLFAGNQLEIEMSRRTRPLHRMPVLVNRYQAANGGRLPVSVVELELVYEPELVESDRTGNRVFARGVLLKDVTDVAGVRRAWAVAFLVPRRGWFDRVARDSVHVVYDEGQAWGTADEMRRRFGGQLVEEVYRQHRHDVSGSNPGR